MHRRQLRSPCRDKTNLLGPPGTRAAHEERYKQGRLRKGLVSLLAWNCQRSEVGDSRSAIGAGFLFFLPCAECKVPSALVFALSPLVLQGVLPPFLHKEWRKTHACPTVNTGFVKISNH